MRGTIRRVTVRLEPWGEDDLPLVQALLGDPVMMEHLGGPEAPEKIVERHRRYLGVPGVLQDHRRRRRVPAGSATGSTSGRASRSTRSAGPSCRPSRAAASPARARGSRWKPRGRATGRAPSTRSRCPTTARPTRSAASWASRCSGEVEFEFPKGHFGAEQRLVPTTSARRPLRLEHAGSSVVVCVASSRSWRGTVPAARVARRVHGVPAGHRHSQPSSGTGGNLGVPRCADAGDETNFQCGSPRESEEAIDAFSGSADRTSPAPAARGGRSRGRARSSMPSSTRSRATPQRR